MSSEYQDMSVILVKAKADKEAAQAAEVAEQARKAQESKEILKSVVNEPEPVEPDTTTEEEVSEDEALASDEETETQVEPEPTKQPRSKAAEKRIAKLVKEREQLKGQLALIQNNQQPSQPVQSQPIDPVTIDPTFPNPANYRDGVNDLDYRLDIRDYQREQAKKDTNFKTAIKAAVEKYPDLPELIEEDASRTNATMAQMIKESPVSVDLFYYLMANPEVSNKIDDMTPTQSAKEIGKIEAKLEDKAKTATPSAKKAASLPAPITPIKSTKAAGTSLKQTRYTVY